MRMVKTAQSVEPDIKGTIERTRVKGVTAKTDAAGNESDQPTLGE